MDLERKNAVSACKSIDKRSFSANVIKVQLLQEYLKWHSS